MPISVQCPNPDCGKTLQIKEQFAGKAGECPYCNGPLMVPKLNEPPAPAPAPKSDKPAPLIEVHCPHPGCGRTIRVRQEMAGKAGKCPGCGKAILVPYPEAPATQSAAPEQNPPAPAGGDSNDPLAGDIKLAPIAEEKKAEAGFELVEEEGGFDLVEDEEPQKGKPGAKPAKGPAAAPKQPAGSQGPLISVVCPSCWAKMKAPAKFAGKTVPCLKCKGPVQVPAAGGGEAAPWLQPAAPAPGPAAADFLAGDAAGGAAHFSPFVEAVKAKKSAPEGPGKAAAPPRFLGASADECSAAMLCHALAIVTSFVGPLIIWLLKRGHSRFVDDQGREVLNFLLNLSLVGLVLCGVPALALLSVEDAETALWVFAGVGLVAILLNGYALVLVILAAVEAKRGVRARYPLTIRLIPRVLWDETPVAPVPEQPAAP